VRRFTSDRIARSIGAYLGSMTLCLPCLSNASTSVNICQAPAQEAHFTVGYYEQEKSGLAGGPGATNRTNYTTDLQVNSGSEWVFGAGHRSSILNVDDLALQTNGYLHTFFFPIHRTTASAARSFRFSVAPAVSGSSNVTKDPGEYTRDSLQLLAAFAWNRQIADRLGLNYGICADHRFGDFQIYPVIGVNWQPHPDWQIELGFPASQVSYQASTTLHTSLRVMPNGNEWHVKDKKLENESQLVYDGYLIEWALNWRPHRQFQFTGSVGREFDARYEMTLADGSRVRLVNDAANRIGLTLAWFF